MKFLRMILSLALTAISSIVTTYIETKTGKTNEWKRLLGGALPMVFSYLEKPIVTGVENQLEGSEKFQKALQMAERYLSKYVNVDVAQSDLMAYIQHEFFLWQQRIKRGDDVIVEVIVDGRPLTIDEVV